MKYLAFGTLISFLAIVPGFAHEGHDHNKDTKSADEQTVLVKGEVLDMVCYIDHNAQGEKHASCAKTCIESGLPVGIKDVDGKVYLLVGEHKPINKSLAPFAAKIIAMKGKLVSRDGINMLENAEIIKEETSGDKKLKTMYTCPMHADVNQPSPGKCPKCGMNLEPVKK